LVESQAFTLAEVDAAHDTHGQLYLQFLEVPSMSLGLYVLEAGAVDPQLPHEEDEIYYVVSGRGRLRVEDDDYPAEPGSILFVAKHVDHRFHSIAEELRVLVFFAPKHTG
jgi:mannose-6-phosphate isomerase-like protein (cupin superfamily)